MPLEALARASQGLAKARLAHRFGQVVDGIHLECLDGVLVERRDEDHEWQKPAPQQPDDAEPVDFRHLDVEERDVGVVPLDELDRFGAVRRLADDGDVGHGPEGGGQKRPRWALVVGDDDPQPSEGHPVRLAGKSSARRGWRSAGSSMRTVVPCPGALWMSQRASAP